MPTKLEVVQTLYVALQKGNAPTLLALLHPEFVGHLTEGLPHGIGGTKQGFRAMLGNWAAVARHFAIAPMPLDIIDTTDDRVVVSGRYEGTARATGKPLNAAFVHIWRIRDGQLIELRQVTDSQRWVEASG